MLIFLDLPLEFLTLLLSLLQFGLLESSWRQVDKLTMQSLNSFLAKFTFGSTLVLVKDLLPSIVSLSMMAIGTELVLKDMATVLNYLLTTNMKPKGLLQVCKS